MTNNSTRREAAPTTWALLTTVFSLVATAEKLGGPAAIVIPTSLNGYINQIERAAAKTGRAAWVGEGRRFDIRGDLRKMRTALAA